MVRFIALMVACWFTSWCGYADDAMLVAAHKTLPSGKRWGKEDALLLVLVKEQRMVVSLGGVINHSFRVSTALAGVGRKAHSSQTPPGWHRVYSRFGGKAQIGQVLKSRRVMPGVIVPESGWRSEGDEKVLSRLLWLEGLEPGVNKSKNGDFDSYLRHVYIHGTNQEQKLGKPASHGCIRMGNKDIVELFELIKPFENVYVYIEER